jgi:predicted lactoylglutathione lyase
MKLPSPVPELPVSDIQAARVFYKSKLGFSVDWIYENQIAGISKDSARIFIRLKTDEEKKQAYSVLIWLNMNSAAEVDELYESWKNSGVQITDELETKPWNLREFTAADPDGNRFRVFHDLGAKVEHPK